MLDRWGSPFSRVEGHLGVPGHEVEHVQARLVAGYGKVPLRTEGQAAEREHGRWHETYAWHRLQDHAVSGRRHFGRAVWTFVNQLHATVLPDYWA